MNSGINKRVLKDIRCGAENLKRDFGILIAPEEGNYYNVHFILCGAKDTPYEGGLYHGMIRLNQNHPISAPNIYIITPNGRFIPESCPIDVKNRGICTTDTAFHPESWSPLKDIERVIIGFYSLMSDKYDGGIGGMDSSDNQKKILARMSHQHLIDDMYVRNLFPDLYKSLINKTYVPFVTPAHTPTETKSNSNATLSTKRQIGTKSDISAPTKKTVTSLSSASESSSSEFDDILISKNKKTNKPIKKEINKRESSKRESSKKESSKKQSSKKESSKKDIKKEKASKDNTKKKSSKEITKKKSIKETPKKKSTTITKKVKRTKYESSESESESAESYGTEETESSEQYESTSSD